MHDVLLAWRSQYDLTSYLTTGYSQKPLRESAYPPSTIPLYPEWF